MSLRCGLIRLKSMKVAWPIALLCAASSVRGDTDTLPYPDSFREKPSEQAHDRWDGDDQEWLDIDDFRDVWDFDKNLFPPYPWEDDTVLQRNSVLPNNFTQTEAISHTCTASIERLKAGPADWKSILGSGRQYIDESMPHSKNEMVYWPSHPRRDELSFASFRVAGFAPPRGNSLWGETGVVPHDIVQGDVGDCYFLSSAASVAEHPDRIKKLFLTQEVS